MNAMPQPGARVRSGKGVWEVIGPHEELPGWVVLRYLSGLGGPVRERVQAAKLSQIRPVS